MLDKLFADTAHCLQGSGESFSNATGIGAANFAFALASLGREEGGRGDGTRLAGSHYFCHKLGTIKGSVARCCMTLVATVA